MSTSTSTSVDLSPNMTGSAIVKHLEAGRTTKDTVVKFLTTSVYPYAELAKLVGVLGDEFSNVLQAQQGMAVASAVKHTPSSRKMVCTIDRAEFLAHATPIEVTLDGVPMTAAPKEFSTGSFGWNLTGKLPRKVGDATVQLQVSVNLTVIGSKSLA